MRSFKSLMESPTSSTLPPNLRATTVSCENLSADTSKRSAHNLVSLEAFICDLVSITAAAPSAVTASAEALAIVPREAIDTPKDFVCPPACVTLSPNFSVSEPAFLSSFFKSEKSASILTTSSSTLAIYKLPHGEEIHDLLLCCFIVLFTNGLLVSTSGYYTKFP